MSTGRTIRILLVDDHRLLRQGLRALLENEAGFEIIAEAQDGRTAIRLAAEMSPDVVVMDVRMPDLNGIDATRRLVEARPDCKVVALSAHVDNRTTAEMLRAGASGYIPKDSAFTELATAVRTVAAGKVYLSPTIASVLVQDIAGDRREVPTVFNTLTTREREVLQLVAEGKATKQVAAHLHVSVKTVETHRRSIMEKLKLDGVAELTKYAVREGLTSLD